MKKELRILFCPLNWGLGHASRMIPLIEAFINAGHNAILGGNGVSLDLLKARFPHLKSLHIEGINIKYGKKKAFNFKFIIKMPLMLLSIYKENRSLKKTLKSEKFDIIISDNRPGLFHKNVLSIYITHQLNIFVSEKAGFLNKIASSFHRYIINKYSLCWVPDYAEPYSLAGKLSVNYGFKCPIINIGALSRFMNMEIIEKQNKSIDFLCILSGAEPQREIFERLIIEKFRDVDCNLVIIRGLPGGGRIDENFANISFFNHPDDKKFLELCSISKRIICRSGYSTIMDLFAIKRRAILVPTPGQTEQEQIAKHLHDNFDFMILTQKEFEIADVEELKIKNNIWNSNPVFDNISEEIQRVEKLIN